MQPSVSFISWKKCHNKSFPCTSSCCLNCELLRKTWNITPAGRGGIKTIYKKLEYLQKH